MADFDIKQNSDFDAFNFKVLCLLVCRGDIKTKAGYLFDLVDNGSVINHVPGKGAVESSIIWSSKRLKKAIQYMLFYSELFPRVFYLRLKDDIPTDFDGQFDGAGDEIRSSATNTRDMMKAYKTIKEFELQHDNIDAWKNEK